MNKLLQNYVKIAIIGMVASGPAHAQMLPQWSTVDFFQAPGLSASASDVGTSADGLTLFSVGAYRYNDAGDACAIVRTSTDSGANWAPAGTAYLEPGWQYATYRGFGAGPGGALYAAGELWNRNASTNEWRAAWVVRQSTDGGANWVTADKYEKTEPDYAKLVCADVKVNAVGDVYAVGGATINGHSWEVRKRAAGATNFQTIDMVGPTFFLSKANSVAIHPTAGVFVVGLVDYGSGYLWTVRRSTNGGANWSTVDKFQDTKWTYSEACSIAVGPAPAYVIYVCGRAGQVVKGKTVSNWVVRRSLNGGATWSTVERFGAEPAPNGIGEATARGITVTPSGTVFMTGVTPPPARLLVRKGTTASNGTMTWVTSDDLSGDLPYESSGNAITSDAQGNLFTAGKGLIDSSDLGYFLTRKLAGPQ